MPSMYRYKCTVCGHTEVRYRNLKQCRKCGGPVERVVNTKYKVTDHVKRAWRPNAGSGVIEKIDVSGPEPIYFVRFPLCEDWYKESDLIPEGG